jgi:hypothetical protein
VACEQGAPGRAVDDEDRAHLSRLVERVHQLCPDVLDVVLRADDRLEVAAQLLQQQVVGVEADGQQ